MAKQTFTTGSVLTATQMNNLQANDYNQTVNQKTASYVLAASDAGTRIEMNAAGATTVTVNTGLFTAGDTLFIQNIGAGACTVTAGTATVNKATAGSLTLSQYQGGTLYFVSASSAIFFADAGYTPPLTTKGDLFGYDTAAARIPIGANNTVLTADSTQALGLKWAAATSSSDFQLINAGGTALSGSASTTISFSAKNQLYIQIDGASSANGYAYFLIRPNNDSGSKYSGYGLAWKNSATWGYSAVALALNADTSIQWAGGASTQTSTSSGAISIQGTNATGVKPYQCWSFTSGSDGYSYLSSGVFTGNTALTSVVISSSSGNFDAGTVYVYGA